MHSTHVTYDSWFSRMGKALCGVLVGLLLFFGSFVGLWYNEGMAVQTAKSLDEGIRLVLPIDADHLDPANDGKLVHVSHSLFNDRLDDADFGITTDAVRLQRKVECLQFEERSHTRKIKDNFGGQRTETRYTYEEVWRDRPIDSSRFHDRSYSNPSRREWPASSDELRQRSVEIGSLRLSEGLVSQITAGEVVDVGDPAHSAIAASEQLLLNDRAHGRGQEGKRHTHGKHPNKRNKKNGRKQNRKYNNDRDYDDDYDRDERERDREYNTHRDHSRDAVVTHRGDDKEHSRSLALRSSMLPVAHDAIVYENALYLGDPRRPRIGDCRVSYMQAAPDAISVIARQSKGKLKPYKTKAGDVLEMLSVGDVSSDKMFEVAHQMNVIRTWALRGVGWVAMAIGVGMILGPLQVMPEVVPFLGGLMGNVVGCGIFLVAITVSTSLSLVTIALAWVAHRPMVAGVLLALGLGTAYLGYSRRSTRSRAQHATSPRNSRQLNNNSAHYDNSRPNNDRVD